MSGGPTIGDTGENQVRVQGQKGTGARDGCSEDKDNNCGVECRAGGVKSGQGTGPEREWGKGWVQ